MKILFCCLAKRQKLEIAKLRSELEFLVVLHGQAGQSGDDTSTIDSVY